MNYLILGGYGFIGHHLAKKLLPGNIVTVADLPVAGTRGWPLYCNHYLQVDLTKEESWKYIEQHCSKFGMPDVIYQLAADMGGAGYIFTGDHDLRVMLNSSTINIHCIHFALKYKCKVFYSSSACIYPLYNQLDPSNPKCSEDSAYPAAPDSEYGWEKLFSERLYLSAHRNEGLNVRIARFHNIFGPEGTWTGGKEKAPAALCRKVIEAKDTIEIWGPGTQTRSFLYIDECLEGINRLMASDWTGPVNIGSEEMISINDLAKMIIDISGKTLSIKNIPGPVGVMGRNSDNSLLYQKLGWKPSQPLRVGIKKTYDWISEVIKKGPV